MFTDPQSITVNSVAKSLPRVISQGQSATYQMVDESFKLTISHQKSGSKNNLRIRSMARVDQRAIVADPISSANDYETLSFYVVMDRPDVGFTITQAQQLGAALIAWFDSANIAKLYGQES